MTTIGFIGSGMIGGTLARLATAAGYDVVMSNSRGPETLTDLVTDLGERARAGTPEEAAQAGDIVVVTIPMHAVNSLPVESLAGKVVIDTTNYYPGRDGVFPELEDESVTSSELLQRQLPDSQVVKAFNNIFFLHLGTLARPVGDPDRSTLSIAGDQPDAKHAVATFVDAIGYDSLDVGPLAEGWRFQRDTPAYCLPYVADPSLLLSGQPNPGEGKPVSAAELSGALEVAKRYRDM